MKTYQASLLALIVSLFLSILSGSALAQNTKTIGFRLGLPDQQTSKNIGGNTPIKGTINYKWIFGLNYQKEIASGLYLGLDFSTTRASHAIALSEIMETSITDMENIFETYQLGPVLRKEFPLFSKFGVQASLGVLGSYIDHQKRDYVNFEFPRMSFNYAPDGNGGTEIKALNDIIFNGTRAAENKFNVLIRPELGLYFNTGTRGKVTLDALYGAYLRSPMIERNYTNLIHEGKSYTASDSFSGSYMTLMIGYRYFIH
jgi:hypothetical protein